MKKTFLSLILFLLTTQISFSQNYLYGDKKQIFSKYNSSVIYGEQIDSTTYAIEVTIKKKSSYITSYDTLRWADPGFTGKHNKIEVKNNQFTLSPGNIKLIRRSYPINSDPFTSNFDLIYNYPGYSKNFDSASISDYGNFWLRKKHIVRKDSSYVNSLWAHLTNINLIQQRTYTNAQIHLGFFYLAFGIIQPIFFLIIYPAGVATIILLETEKFLINNIHGNKTIIVKLYSGGKSLKLRVRKDAIITERFKYRLAENLDGFLN